MYITLVARSFLRFTSYVAANDVANEAIYRDPGDWKTTVIKCLSNGRFPASSNYSNHVNISGRSVERWTGITSFPDIRKFDRTYEGDTPPFGTQYSGGF